MQKNTFGESARPPLDQEGLIGRLAEDGFVAILHYFHGEFEFCVKQEGCLLDLASSPLL